MHVKLTAYTEICKNQNWIWTDFDNANCQDIYAAISVSFQLIVHLFSQTYEMDDINLHYRFLNWRRRIREIREVRAVRYQERYKRMLKNGDTLRYVGLPSEWPSLCSFSSVFGNQLLACVNPPSFYGKFLHCFSFILIYLYILNCTTIHPHRYQWAGLVSVKHYVCVYLSH